MKRSASRRKYADHYDFAPIGCFTFDRNGLILEANMTGAQMLGATKRRLARRSFAPFLAGSEDRRSFFAHLTEVRQKRMKETCEVTLRGTNGAKIHAQLQSVPGKDVKGRSTLIRTAVIDISERTRAEKWNEHLASIPQMNPNPAVEVDSAGRIVFANDGTRQILKDLGLDAENAAPFLPADMDGLLREWDGKTLSTVQRVVTIKDKVFEETIHFVPQFGAVRIYGQEITKRKLFEEALRESERKFILLFQKAGFGVVLETSPDGVLVDINEAAEKMLGFTKQEVIGKTSRDLGLYPDPAVRSRIFSDLAERGGVSDREVTMRVKSGEKRIFLLNIIPLELGGRQHHLATLKDITARKRAEAALQESEEHFRSLLSQSPVAIELYDIEGKLIDANPACLRMFGVRSIEAVQGFSLFDDPNIPADAKQRLKDGEPVHYESLFDFDIVIARRLYETTRSGRCFIECFINRWNDSSGEMRGYLVFVTEITERKRAEDALRASRSRLEAVFRAVPNPIIEFDARGVPVMANEAALKVLGVGSLNFTRAQAIEKLKFENPDGGAVRSKELPVSRALRGEVVAGDLYRIRTADGNWRVISAYASPLVAASGGIVGAVALWHDITDRKRAGEALRESERRLSRAEQIAHLGSWELDLVDNVLTWSDEVYRIFGLKTREFAATYEAFLETVHPDDRAAVDAAYSGSIREGKDSYEIEHRIVRRSTGEIRIVHEKCEHVRDASGRILRSAGMVHDITERKQTEQALGISEAKYQLLFRNMAEGFALYELLYDESGKPVDWRVLEVNDAYSFHTGVSREKIVGRCMSELFPAAIPDYLPRFAEVVAAQRPQEFETYAKSVGRYQHVICFPAGPNRFANTIYDITERRIAEKALRKSEYAHRTLAQNIPDIVFRADLSRTETQFFNNRIFEITGYAPEELNKGRFCSMESHILKKDRQRVIDTVTRAIRDRSSFELEYRFLHKSGRTVVLFERGVVISDEAGVPLFIDGIIRDITERKQAEEKIARKNALLAEISRLFRNALGYTTEEALAADCLAAAVTTTQSGFGFIGEIGPDGMLHEIAMSDSARHACSLPEKTGHRVPSAGLPRCGLNGKVLKEGRPFLTNDPAAHPDRHGTPEGHPPLASFLGVPLLSGEDVIGVVAVANREGGYEIEQQEALETLAPVIVEAIGRKRTESALKQYRTGLEQRVQERTAQVEEQARVLGAFFKHTPTCLVILDRKFNFVLVNEAYARACSRSISDFGGHNYFTDYPSDDLRKEFQRVVDTGKPYSASSRPFVFPGNPEHGAGYWDLAVSSILDERGATELVVFSLVDVTGRKRSEERISRLNRLYTVLSRVNEAIVRIRDRQELFKRICRIAVEDGSFRMVWIGLSDPETLRVRPTASHGDEGGYLDAFMKFVPRDPSVRSPADKAVHEGREVICDDIKQNIIMLPWRDLTLAHGFQSMASIPLRGDSGVIGAVSFYADSSWFFADDEIGLLTSLADDLSFAVQAMEKERLRVEAEERTRTTNELLALFSRTFGRKAYLDAVVELIRRSCKCSAAGIRVADAFGNISYEASAGFSEDFLAPERTLSLERDFCICTRIARGEPDPQDLPSVTPGGSFFSNNTTRFLEGLTAEQRSRFRVACHRKGYLTVGVVPIRYRGKALGVIHVADEQEGKAPPACVEFLEQAALFIGEALFRFGVEEESFRLAAAVESAADAVVVTEPARGVIQYVNAAFERVTGYSPAEAVGRTLHLLDSGKHDDAFYHGIRDAIERDGVWNGRLVSRKKDGTLYFEDCTYSPVRSPAGGIVSYVSIKRDVTERLRLESIAESDNLMSNIGYVFSGVRHEIGNPVNSAKMALSVLRQKLGSIGTDAVRDYVDRTLAEIGRVEQLLRSLRNFNLYESPELEPFDMAAFLERFAGLVANDLAKKGIAFSQEMLPGAELALADTRALQQVLLNLVTNAVDSLEGRPDPRIAITAERLHDHVAVRVADNGAGMTESQQRDLFKPFYTTKTGGTGLGLVIVKKMLSQMNCGIEIESAPDKGTVVNIFLPEGRHAETR